MVSVDDMPVVQDVFINGQWRSVLVGSLRLGGRGIFALDVTEPMMLFPLISDARFRRDTGFAPKTPLAEGIARWTAWFRSYVFE